MVACEMRWDNASRLKSASQRSKLPVLRQFSWAQPVAVPANRNAAALHASPIRRISKGRIVLVRLLRELLFPRKFPAASGILPPRRCHGPPFAPDHVVFASDPGSLAHNPPRKLRRIAS